MKLFSIFVFLFTSFTYLQSQCGLTGMQSQLIQNSSFPIQNSSTTSLSVKIVDGNYPITLGVDDSGGSLGDIKLFSAGEADIIIADASTQLGTYRVRINNSTMGCVDTVDVEVIDPNQCPSTPTEVGINEIGTLLITPVDQPIRVTVIDGYPLLELDDINHSTWGQTEPEAPGGNIIDYMTSGNTGTVVIEILNPQTPSFCRDTVQIQIVNTLPVVWLRTISVYLKDDKSVITFSTASEINNSHFEIEHNQNNTVFKSIGKIQGQGNISEEINYEFIHENPVEGLNYYRIKQVDLNGKYSYSNVASVVHKTEKISVYPNPLIDRFTVNSPINCSVSIYDQAGKKVEYYQLAEGQNEIDMSKKESGVYILRFSDGSIMRVVKN